MSRSLEPPLGSRGYDTRPDVLLWLIPFLLNGLGMLVITSTTTPKIFGSSGSLFWVGLKQLQWMLIGWVGFIVGWRIPFRVWMRTSGILWVVSIFLVFCTLLPGIGATIGGARRWIRIAGLSFQPGEVLYLFFSIHLTKMLHKHDKDEIKSFIVLLSLIFLSAAPLLLQPDLGTIILIFTIGMGIFVERHGWRLPLVSAVGGVVILVLLIVAEPYRMRRVVAFLDPWKDPLDTGFQAIQGLIAFSNGGLWGTGLGHGFQKLQYLPAAYTDFIFAALGEEMGLVGTMGVLALFFIWTMRVKRYYFEMDDDIVASMLWAMVLTIITPFFINVGGVTKMMPLTGMPLPFLSYGGTSLVMMWFRLGMVMGICSAGASQKRGLA
ncbi:bacterial cell division membrane protein [Thermanaerovibrio velox DSM 12556]|uniref:Probable peptidoglycan glycosyltransferase FtsW n=1 Tax=Thermanaerovibrio velox DSM 12556 TaxID=926567 RepID=H0URR1_9BACT|nr:putative peptidoglycan glycosyltransferase FtsW [Thermanaerovibrio velox]EHM10000.1 bacterial cell division membrane protein [Thermanaerovibrio velox DSM 12556]